MTYQEEFKIFSKVVRKAKKNGLKVDISDYMSIDGHNFEYLIFNHDFAKAFWGEDKIEYTEYPFCYHVNGGDESRCTDTAWRVHLSQMVLEKEPLKYLEKFL